MQAQPSVSRQALRPGGDVATDQLREQAITQIRKKRGFKVHLLVYLTVNTMLVVLWAALAVGGWGQYVNVQLTPEKPLPTGFFWPIFPILGWGFGLVMHGYAAYRGDRYTEAQIEREMRRLQ